MSWKENDAPILKTGQYKESFKCKKFRYYSVFIVHVVQYANM